MGGEESEANSNLEKLRESRRRGQIVENPSNENERGRMRFLANARKELGFRCTSYPSSSRSTPSRSLLPIQAGTHDHCRLVITSSRYRFRSNGLGVA